ncbi:MAG: multiprotein-bridging factor 1 family protein [Parvularculaceae bacterium]
MKPKVVTASVSHGVRASASDGDRETARLIGRVLGNLRRAEGLSRDELAERIDVAAGVVDDWEEARLRPTRNDVMRVASALNFDARDFFQMVGEFVVDQPAQGAAPRKEGPRRD